MRFLKLAAVAAVAIFALVACGGSSAPGTGAAAPTTAPAGATATAVAPAAATATPAAPAGGATTPSAKLCSLLSPADLKSAMGADYGAGVPDENGGIICHFYSGGGTEIDNKGYIIADVRFDELSVIKTSYSDGGSDASVSGHAAYWNPKNKSLWVDIGSQELLRLTFGPIITNDTQAAAQTLATIIIGKL